MKKIFFLLLACMLAFSCKEAEADIYKGESYLNFNKGVSSNAFVLNSQTYNDVKISYGTVKAVQEPHQVKLVFQSSGSTAVQGTDFEILNNATDNLTAGEVGGEFTIRIYKASATQAGKTAMFKLQSDLPNAGFDQTYTLNMSLTCPVSSFVGVFNNTTNWWYDNPGGQFLIQESTATANQLLIKDFYDVGRDLVLNYNPTTFVVSVPDQYTGSKYGAAPYAGVEIWARPSTDPSQISSFNPCTRVLTLYANYYLKGTNAGFGNQKEVFTGL